VEWNETTARARLHDLARLFANKHLNDTTRMDSRRRHAAHYQKVSATADSLYRQGGERLIQGLALFDLEWMSIRLGHTWAAQNGDKDEQALSLCNDYPAHCPSTLSLRQHPRERIQWLETALNAARKLARKQAEGWHLGNLGLAYYALGEYRRAIEYHEQHLTIAQEISAASHSEAQQTAARRHEGHALSNLGSAYRNLGEYRYAVECHEQALAVAREIGDRQGEGAALGNLGLTYNYLGEYCRAIEYHEQYLIIARELGDRHGEDNALGNLGTAYYGLKDYQRAREYNEQQRTVALEIGDRRGEAHSLWGLALCFDAVNDRPQAIAHAQAALDIYIDIESPYAQEVCDFLAKWQRED
jgi:tetratricopeptide (TPR) repeat protein